MSKEKTAKWRKTSGAGSRSAAFVAGPRALVVSPSGDVHLWTEGGWRPLPPLTAKARHRAFSQDRAGVLYAYADRKLWRLEEDARWQTVDKGGGPGPAEGVALCGAEEGIVAFGGRRGGKALATTWSWAGRWEQRGASGPPGRGGACMVVDGAGAVWLFGGSDAKGKAVDDAWRLEGGEWRVVASAGVGLYGQIAQLCLEPSSGELLGLPYGFTPPHRLASWRGTRFVASSELPKLAKGSYAFGVDAATSTLLALREDGKACYTLPLGPAPTAEPLQEASSAPPSARVLRRASRPAELVALAAGIGADLLPALSRYFEATIEGPAVRRDPQFAAAVSDLYTAEEALVQWRIMRDLPGVRWDAAWIPIADDGAGNVYFADHRDGTVGLVLHDPPDELYGELAPEAWLARLERDES